MAAPGAVRLLPSVDELLRRSPLADAEHDFGHEVVLRSARRVLERARGELLAEPDVAGDSRLAGLTDADLLALEAAELARTIVAPPLKRVINATGVVIHTNLGRAPLCDDALQAIALAAAGYSNLELDLDTGARGDRQEHVQGILRELLGVEAALVVNNNASAVMLAISALARGKEAVVARGQAVEIGGGFRIPEVMRRGGARLVEVGTTNRVYLQDYTEVIGPRTAILLRVHTSNFRVVGFTHETSIEDLGRLAQAHGVLLLDDLGSGALIDTSQFGLRREPLVQDSVAAGADVICFSGDKLLGGPQAGILVGRRAAIDRCRRDPLMRAMRTDKVTLAALQATLLQYLTGRAREALPVWRMIGAPVEELQRRVARWAERVPGSEVVPGRSAVGGGSLPEETLPTALLALPAKRSASALLAALRRAGIIARAQERRVVLDPRTVQVAEEDRLLAVLADLS